MSTEEQVVLDWFADGQPVTNIGVPHEVKAFVISKWAGLYGLETFVETGTFHGAMVEAVAERFKQIYTIEMYQPNFKMASRKLARFSHVKCLFGDSGKEILDIVNDLDGPACFFLDAHYSGGGTARGAVDTPVMAELAALSQSPHPNVIVIDDARLFRGEAFHDLEEFKDYPSFEDIEHWVAENFGVASKIVRDADEFVICPVIEEQV